jgi:hypothetical protein
MRRKDEIMENITTPLITQLQIDDKSVQGPIILPVSTSENVAAGDHLSKLLSAQEQATVYAAPQMGPAASGLNSTNTLGDAILRRLDSLGSEFRKKVDHLQESLKVPPGTFSVQQMLQLQMEMSMVSIEVEVVGKGVQKAVQHADQLTKLQ